MCIGQSSDRLLHDRLGDFVCTDHAVAIFPGKLDYESLSASTCVPVCG